MEPSTIWAPPAMLAQSGAARAGLCICLPCQEPEVGKRGMVTLALHTPPPACSGLGGTGLGLHDGRLCSPRICPQFLACWTGMQLQASTSAAAAAGLEWGWGRE